MHYIWRVENGTGNVRACWISILYFRAVRGEVVWLSLAMVMALALAVAVAVVVQVLFSIAATAVVVVVVG